MSKMRAFLLTPALILFAFGVVAEESDEKKTLASFTLEDQHEKSHSFEFPRKKPLVFTIADMGGAKDAPIWSDTIKEKYGERIDFWSMANLSFIPELGRAAARVGIRATSKEPVLCDWDGAIAAKMKADKGRANVVVFSETGENLIVAFGTVEEEKLEKVYAAIDGVLERTEVGDDKEENES